MIVIGNPETLQKDRNWFEFVKYCHENGACAGDPFKMKEFVETAAQDEVTELSEELQGLEIID
jgi:hypothetical protein